MTRELEAPAAPLRCLAVWSAVSAGTAAALLAVHDELQTVLSLAHDGLAGRPFDALLLMASAVVLTACAIWFWLVTTLTVARAVTGRVGRVRGCPDGVRRLVLAACGLTLLVVASPASADTIAGSPPGPEQPHVLAGLPYPDRATMPATAPGTTPAQERGEVRAEIRVAPGDTLWSIAEESLGSSPDITEADVERRWRAIWHANRAEVGPDPDLIHPGTTLRLPTSKES